VAVCSDPDLDAPHVREADAAVRLPGADAARTYLRGHLLVDAALRARADAVHPGYGFLSENAGFARAVIDAGLTWIGPSPEAIAAMGDKIEAKRLAEAAGVPVLAGLDPDKMTEEDLPVLVKAAAGGGGRGMRVIRRLAGLPAGIKASQSEAATSFGDSSVFIEPFIERSGGTRRSSRSRLRRSSSGRLACGTGWAKPRSPWPAPSTTPAPARWSSWRCPMGGSGSLR
jgi:propionyl-CoA carboxylase alpha chain